MNRLTAILIAENESVHASFYGPVNEKYGLYIGMMDKAPSGHERPRCLLTSEPIYESGEAAKEAGNSVIAKVRNVEFDSSEGSRRDPRCTWASPKLREALLSASEQDRRSGVN